MAMSDPDLSTSLRAKARAHTIVMGSLPTEPFCEENLTIDLKKKTFLTFSLHQLLSFL